MKKIIALATVADCTAIKTILHQIWDQVVSAIWQERLGNLTLLMDEQAVKKEAIGDTLACFRLTDQKSLFNVPKILEFFEILRPDLRGMMTGLMAHEMGHFSFIPATKSRQTEALIRIENVLQEKNRHHSGFIANLFGDFVIDSFVFHYLYQNKYLEKIPFIKLRQKMAEKNGQKTSWPVFQALLYKFTWRALSQYSISVSLYATPPSPDSYSGKVPLDTIKADVQVVSRTILRLIRLRHQVEWLDEIEAFAKLFEKYLEDDHPPCCGENKPFSPEDLDEKTIKDILDRHGNKEIDNPMDFGKWKNLMKRIFPEPAKRVATFYHYRAKTEVFAPVQQPSFSSGPLVPTYTRQMRGKDPMSTWKPEATFQSACPKPIPGFNMERQVSFLGKGILKGVDYPDMVIYMDQSGSMPNPLEEESNMSLAALVFAYTTISFDRSVKLSSYSYDPDQWTGPEHEVFWGTREFTRDEKEICEQVIHAPGPGRLTLFPIRKFVQDVKAAAESKQCTHFVVLSDLEVSQLLRQKEKWLPYFQKNDHLYLEIIMNPQSGFDGPSAEEIQAISAHRNIGWHTLNDGWTGLLNYTKRRARELFNARK